MKLFLITITFAFLTSNGYAMDVHLAWDEVPDPDLHHYTLYQAEKDQGTTEAWQKIKDIDKALTTTTVTIEAEKNFSWYVTATGTTKGESGPSNTVDLYKEKDIESPTCLNIPLPL